MNCNLTSLTYMQDCHPYLYWWLMNFVWFFFRMDNIINSNWFDSYL